MGKNESDRHECNDGGDAVERGYRYLTLGVECRVVEVNTVGTVRWSSGSSFDPGVDRW